KSTRSLEAFDHENFGAGIVDALSLLQRDPAADAVGGGAEAAAGPVGDELRDLLDEAFGTGGLEAVAPVIADRQHAPELACAALDRLRAAPTLRAHVESMPPPLLSPSLRAKLGARAEALR